MEHLFIWQAVLNVYELSILYCFFLLLPCLVVYVTREFVEIYDHENKVLQFIHTRTNYFNFNGEICKGITMAYNKEDHKLSLRLQHFS